MDSGCVVSARTRHFDTQLTGIEPTTALPTELQPTYNLAANSSQLRPQSDPSAAEAERPSPSALRSSNKKQKQNEQLNERYSKPPMAAADGARLRLRCAAPPDATGGIKMASLRPLMEAYVGTTCPGETASMNALRLGGVRRRRGRRLVSPLLFIESLRR
ncbi:hypothetical protein EYF80_025555 [Liparis tanakae]|uniref:Uncharacterized protein n=1 Tax=Liparis tanakae TaxID=230148 RepID=A0A4Z2HE90_9TELE|nr:hypothetical protein EYF80_025555 [Liparis tanakae]